MFPLLRFLPFLFFGSLLLIADPLGAEGPPPLPRPAAAKALLPPKTNNVQLEGLRVGFSGGKITDSKIGFIGTPALVQAPQTVENSQTVEQLPSTTPISQATFTTIPVSQLSVEEPPTDTLPGTESNDSYIPPPNELLDKSLFTKKTVTEGSEATEDEVPNAVGWGNKLVKPELAPVLSVGGSLLIVIAAFFLLAVLLRKVSPKGNRPLPKEAFECLGRYFLTQKHQLQVLRMGNRIVLVSVMPDSVSTLAEMTDPDETVAFLGLCRRLDENSATEMFRKTIANMSEDELSRPHDRPVITARRKGQQSAALDLYSDPDESLASILARGKFSGG